MTLEQKLNARLKDPNGHRASVQLSNGKLTIVMPEIGGNGRITLFVRGDDVSLTDTPAPKDSPKADTAKSDKSAKRTSKVADA